MGFKTSDEEGEIMAEINMTPLIDIMLVLLIIFMVTSSISLESGLDISLPKTSSKTTAKEGKSILISMSKEGELSVQGKKSSYESVQRDIARAIEVESSTIVIFEGDTSASLGEVIKIMDLAKEVGATEFAIAAEN